MLKIFFHLVSLVFVAWIMSGCSLNHQFNVKLSDDYKAKAPLDYQMSSIDVTRSVGHGDLHLLSLEFLSKLKTALNEALIESAIFDNKSQNDVKVVASVLINHAPDFGFNMTVDSKIKYDVIKLKDGSVLYTKTITSSGTATPGEKFVGVERMYLANDRAIQNNIKLFIKDLESQLNVSIKK